MEGQCVKLFNLTALPDIQSGLRQCFVKSAMSQPALIAEGLQRALGTMWQRWCDDLSPVALDMSENQMNHETRPLEDEKQRGAQ